MDSNSPDHHKDTCSNHDLSNDGQRRFDRVISKTQRDKLLHRTFASHREFGASWGDTRTHRDATIKIGWAKKSRDHGIVAHDDHAIVAINPSSSNKTAHEFRVKILYKYPCSSFVS